jgi:hypothetical protein
VNISGKPVALALRLCLASVLLAAPLAVMAQAAAPSKSKEPVKPKKAVTPKEAPTAKKPTASRTETKSTANQMATGIMAAEAALTPAELAIAGRVYIGKLPCELGAFVTLAPDPKAPGYFDVQIKATKFRMFPVETTTGAIRLEDKNAGAVWLQLANKSMLMNQKLGQRLADACMSPAQVAVAAALEKNPGRSILDAPEVAASAPGSATK